jgi:hypothetical protein
MTRLRDMERSMIDIDAIHKALAGQLRRQIRPAKKLRCARLTVRRANLPSVLGVAR